MKTHRRSFLRRLAQATAAMTLTPLAISADPLLHTALKRTAHLSPQECAMDEDFWYLIRQAYTVSPNIINLNNGGVSPQPKVVQEAVEHYNRLSNETPSYYMWRILDQGKEPLRQRLALLAGCEAGELAINRNASEALETVIFGLRLKAGDEVVLSKQDYPNMINAWKQREHRDGIVLKWVSMDFPFEDDNYAVETYANAFTNKTKVVHITHMINWNGQLLPAARIAEEAKKRNIEVLVDGAHSFAHIDYKIPDLKCDYFGTSLHKWLCAPFGSGLLYVKKDKIRNLYPLFGAGDPESEDISKFEHLGTRSFAIEQAIGHAINFHEMIGGKRKQERLFFLKKYWTEKVKNLPGIYFQGSRSPDRSGAICLVGFQDKEHSAINQFLFKEFKIHAVGIKWEDFKGVRITPNVYTLTSKLDRLVDAFRQFVKEG